MVIAATAAIVTAACGSTADPATSDAPSPTSQSTGAASQPFTVRGVTVEEATLVASGLLVNHYGIDADPVPQQWQWEASSLDGEPVWELDVLVDVLIDGERTQRRWRLSVGAEGPQPVIRQANELDPE